MDRIKKAPFYRDRTYTNNIMLDVIIALIPVSIMAVVKFGLRSILFLAVGVLSALIWEYICNKIKGEEPTIKDLSACVTGLLLGLSFPITTPIWIIVLASFIAIVIIKQLPGGIGKNTFNPAVFARVFVKIILTPFITNWVSPLPDMVSSATPLEYLGNGVGSIPADSHGLYDLFMGNIGGNIGEPVKWAILLGYIYLVIRKTINPWVPIATIGGLFFTTLLIGKSDYNFALHHILSGTAMFAAVFMVTDYTSGPLNYWARIHYGLCIGILTGIIRYLFNFPGGIGVSILIMNLLAPIFDRANPPRVFGFKNPISSFNRTH